MAGLYGAGRSVSRLQLSAEISLGRPGTASGSDRLFVENEGSKSSIDSDRPYFRHFQLSDLRHFRRRIRRLATSDDIR